MCGSLCKKWSKAEIEERVRLGGLDWIVDETRRQTLCIVFWSVCCERSRWCTGHMNEMSIQHCHLPSSCLSYCQIIHHPHFSVIFSICYDVSSHSCHPLGASTLLTPVLHGDTPSEPF